MRLFEIVLSLANLLTLTLAAIPRTNTPRWIRHFIPVVVLIAVAQGMLEGMRWQMFPAYTLTGIFFLVWLRGNVGPASELPSGLIGTDESVSGFRGWPRYATMRDAYRYQHRRHVIGQGPA